LDSPPGRVKGDPAARAKKRETSIASIVLETEGVDKQKTGTAKFKVVGTKASSSNIQI
jgi:hypothetical protein